MENEKNLKSKNGKVSWFLNIFVGFVGAVIVWGVFLILDWINPLLGWASIVYVTPVSVVATSIIGSKVVKRFNSSGKYVVVFFTIVIVNVIFTILFWMFDFYTP